jgi:hypothetical protein
MKRQYYVSHDLNDIKSIETELAGKGFITPQIHVLSEDDAEVEKRHLHAIEAVLKKDVVHSTELGAIVGLISACVVLATTYLMGWHTTAAGWIPSGFLAIIILGFCTWEGGLIGMQIPNYQFKRFQKLLAQGNHVLFVDFEAKQQAVLDQVVEKYPSLKLAGTGDPTPAWVVHGQDKFNKAMKALP